MPSAGRNAGDNDIQTVARKATTPESNARAAARQRRQLVADERKKLEAARSNMRALVLKAEAGQINRHQVQSALREILDLPAGYVRGSLSSDELAGIRAFEKCLSDIDDTIVVAKCVSTMLDALLGPQLLLTWHDPEQVTPQSNKATGSLKVRLLLSGGITATQGVKNGAWQLGELIAKSWPFLLMAGIPVNAHREILYRVLVRYAFAHLAAYGVEYTLNVLTSKKWQKSGFSVNKFTAFSQALDMVFAYVTLSLVGQRPNTTQTLGLVLQAVGVLISTGVIFDIFERSQPGLAKTMRTPVAQLIKKRAAPEGAGEPAREVNESAVPKGDDAKKLVRQIGQALGQESEATWEKQLGELRDTLLPSIETAINTLDECFTDSSVAGDAAVDVARSTEEQSLDNAVMLDDAITRLREKYAHINRFASVTPEAAQDASAGANAEQITQALKHLEKIKNDLDKNGGKTAFFVALGLGYIACMGYGIGGAFSSNPRINNPNVRGAVLAMASVVGVALAQASPLARADNPAYSGLKNFLINWGRAFPGTMLEFPPQQAGFALMEQGASLAKQGAPYSGFPTQADLRPPMEGLKTILLLLMVKYQLNEDPTLANVIGSIVSVGGTGSSIVAGAVNAHKAQPA